MFLCVVSSANNWWLRSPNYNNSNNVYNVNGGNGNGNNNNNAYNANALAPGFSHVREKIVQLPLLTTGYAETCYGGALGCKNR